jgi:hypothetical protein
MLGGLLDAFEYGSGWKWMWLILMFSTLTFFFNFSHGSLQCCLDNNASSTLTQENRVIGYKGVLSISKMKL